MVRKNNKTCPDCGKLISSRSQRCQSCSRKFFLKNNPDFITNNFKGKNNPMYRGSIIRKAKVKYKASGSLITNYCIDCKKPIGKSSTRCRVCSNKFRTGTIYPQLRGLHRTFPQFRKRTTVTCKYCGKVEEVQLCRAGYYVYCSKKCLSLATKGNKRPEMAGELNPSYNPERHEKHYCVECGAELKFYKSILCHSCAFSLERNPNWRNGSSFEPYPLGWNKTFKEQIRYRDGYKCQICGMPEIENGRNLNVHHIDYNKSNLSLDNLISLCCKCHGKTHFNRDFWKNYFKEKSFIVTNK